MPVVGGARRKADCHPQIRRHNYIPLTWLSSLQFLPTLRKNIISLLRLLWGKPKPCLAAETVLGLKHQGVCWQAYLLQHSGRSSAGCQMRSPNLSSQLPLWQANPTETGLCPPSTNLSPTLMQTAPFSQRLRPPVACGQYVKRHQGSSTHHSFTKADYQQASGTPAGLPVSVQLPTALR